MKYTHIYFILLFFLINSCTKSDPTGPGVIAGEPIAIATIGSDGGALETEDFKFIVPPGAFANAIDLKLYVESNNSDLGENAVSDLYRIDGLDGEIQVPIEIKIKYNGELSNESYILVGTDREINSPDSTYADIVYSLINSTESDGYITCNFPKQSDIGKETLSKQVYSELGGFYVSAVTGIESLYTSGGHFRIYNSQPHRHNISDSQKNQLSNTLELSYDKFYTIIYPDLEQLDFIVDVEASMSTLLSRIFISTYTPDNGIDKFHYGMITVYWGSNFVDSKIFYKINWVFTNLAMEDIYGISKSWLTRAISEWSGFSTYFWMEELHEGEISKDILDIFTIPFSLYTYGDEPHVFETLDHGNGLIMEYLVGRYGEQFIRRTLAEISHGTNPLNALISQTKHPKEWLADMYEYFLLDATIQDRITRGYDLINFWKDKTSGELLINSTTNELEVKGDYKDLSAKLYNVKLGTDLQNGSNLTFSTEGGDAEISVFKYNNSTIELIGNDDDPLNIDNVNILHAQGYDLFILVTNRVAQEPDSDTEIALKIKHFNNKRTCTVRYGIAGEVEASGYSTAELNGMYDHFISMSYEKRGEIGTEGFYTSWDYVGADNKYTGFISIIFSNEMTNISQLEVKDNWESLDGNYSTTHDIVAYNIPLLSSNQSYFDYEISGELLCQGHLGSLKYASLSFGMSRILQEIICEGAEDGTPNHIYVKIE